MRWAMKIGAAEKAYKGISFFAVLPIFPGVPEHNQSVYEQPDVVRTYLAHNILTKAEQLIFVRHGDNFQGAQILDIGVGAGRTTPALAAGAADYLGIDYSTAMVATCRARFGNMPRTSFEQDDARILKCCANASVDVAVFSFNGIDCVSPDDRALVLAAAYRVLRPGGRLIFSFHNARCVPALYRYQWQKNPLRWYAAYERLRRIKQLNEPLKQYLHRGIFTIKDGAENFQIDICYVTPRFQMEQIERNGFILQIAYESVSGKVLSGNSLLSTNAPWIYFDCRRVS